MEADLGSQSLKIFCIKSSNSEIGEDFGIVIDGQKVFTALESLTTACALLIGASYALNLAYPKELKYTFEVFQKLLLELDCAKLSPKLNTLKSKLLV